MNNKFKILARLIHIRLSEYTTHINKIREIESSEKQPIHHNPKLTLNRSSKNAITKSDLKKTIYHLKKSVQEHCIS